MHERWTREQNFFDQLAGEESACHRWLARFSAGFYEKGAEGQLWAPLWQTTKLAGKRVLDYACGDGAFSHLLAGRGAQVYGIDISPQLIARARAAAGTRDYPQFVACDAHRTPFPEAFFDYVVGNGALHHLDLQRACAEIARVLKPGGQAFFQEPMRGHPLLRLLRRCTPGSHTADEKPMSLAQVEGAGRQFRGCSHREHYLLAVCAAPAHLLGKACALPVIAALDRLDQALMAAAPGLRNFAWLTVVQYQK
jgi:SAM-dependent methyltransferase